MFRDDVRRCSAFDRTDIDGRAQISVLDRVYLINMAGEVSDGVLRLMRKDLRALLSRRIREGAACVR